MSKRQEIRNLLLVITSGIAAALLLVVWTLNYYNPTGRYLAKNVLLSPQITSQVSYTEKDARSGQMNRYTFDRFEFSFYDAALKRWHSIDVKPEAYQQFYQAVAEDQSLLPIPEEIRNLFLKNPSSLIVKMKNSQPEGKSTFQEVHFAPDYYRVQLRVQAKSQTVDNEVWAYFFHPGIDAYAKALLVP